MNCSLKFIYTFLFLALFSGLISAVENRQTTYTKADPTLVTTLCTENYGSDSRCWRANLKLKGKLVVEFVDREDAADASADATGMVFFEPDNTSRKKLPRALGYYPAPIKAIWLSSNPEAILTPLLGTHRANLALHGKLSRYKYPIEIVLTQFISGIECDHRVYSMEFSSIRLLQPDMLALSKTEYFGC